MNKTDTRKFQMSDFVPYFGAKKYIQRNHLDYDDSFGGFGNPNANLDAYSRANLLVIYTAAVAVIPVGLEAIFNLSGFFN
jgi:hypothetical protein